MKFKTTKKAIKQSFDTILSIGYCNAQHLLKYESVFAYSAGVEGWACDYYEVGNVCISTGYAPTGISVNYDLLKKYELQAEEIAYNNELNWKQQKQIIYDLLVQFTNEVAGL